MLLEPGAAQVVEERLPDRVGAGSGRVHAVEHVRLVAGAVEELRHETALPEAGLGLEEDRASPARAGLAPGPGEGAELAPAALDGRAPVDGDARARSGLESVPALGPPAARLALDEDGLERRAVREAPLRALGQQRPHDLGEERRRVRERRGRQARVGGDGGDRGVAGEGVGSGGQLLEHHAEGVEVGGRPHLTLGELLRRRVVERADELALPGQVDGRLEQLRHAQVGEADLVVAGDEDVLRLQVPVDDPGGVDGLEPRRDLHRDGAEQGLRHGPHLVEQVAEAPPLDELHGQVVVAVLAAGLEGPDDVAAHDGSAHAGLAGHALGGALREEEPGVDHLEGEELAVRLAASGVDDAHPASAHLALDDVVPDALRRGQLAPASRARSWRPSPVPGAPRPRPAARRRPGTRSGDTPPAPRRRAARRRGTPPGSAGSAARPSDGDPSRATSSGRGRERRRDDLSSDSPAGPRRDPCSPRGTGAGRRAARSEGAERWRRPTRTRRPWRRRRR
jgi:hypothetical protein